MMWEVLRPFLIFVAAIALIIIGIYWVSGRPLPLPF